MSPSTGLRVLLVGAVFCSLAVPACAEPESDGRPTMGESASDLTLEQRNNALLVPEQALVPRGTERFVFRVIDGKAVLTRVQMGLRRPGEVEIVSGLEEGQNIVADGQLKLQDGTAITAMAEKPPAAAVK